MTLFVAIWGAALGTITFAWNVWKWRQESPRIVATVEAVRSLWDGNNYVGIRMKLRNRGGKKTTIEKIHFCRRSDWERWGAWAILRRLRREVDWQCNVGASNPKTAKLPVVLDVNEAWDGYVQLEIEDPGDEKEEDQVNRNKDILEILKAGKLRYSVQCSHTHRRICGPVREEDDLIRE